MDRKAAQFKPHCRVHNRPLNVSTNLDRLLNLAKYWKISLIWLRMNKAFPASEYICLMWSKHLNKISLKEIICECLIFRYLDILPGWYGLFYPLYRCREHRGGQGWKEKTHKANFFWTTDFCPWKNIWTDQIFGWSRESSISIRAGNVRKSSQGKNLNFYCNSYYETYFFSRNDTLLSSDK